MKRQITLTLLSLGLVIFFLSFSHITIAAPGDLDPTFSGDGKLITASAATITVTNTNDSGAGSLRQAIADAAPGDTINFNVTGTINLTTGQLVIDKNLTIQGPGANLLSVSGNNVSGRFYINSGVTATLDGVTIRDAFVYNFSGGGISNGGTLTVSNSTISGNSVYDCSDAGCSSVGGGIFNIGTLTVINSTISGNTADFGGGIYNSGTLTVSNSTISGNDDSYGAGGGIANSTYYHPDSTVTITNSTISGNRGGIHSIVDGTETLINTIVANNTAGGTSPEIFGIIETASHNLIGDADSAGGIVNGVSGNIVGVNPLLGPLQNNGGATLTHALLTGSPAINAGNNCVLVANGCGDDNPALPTDQRGLGRVGVVDIGAFELQAEPPTTNVSVSGRVIGPTGRGLAGVTVTLMDTSGNRRSAQTNPFGFYQFTDVAAPGTYTLTAISRRFQFDPQVISVNSDVTDVNFVAQAP